MKNRPKPPPSRKKVHLLNGLSLGGFAFALMAAVILSAIIRSTLWPVGPAPGAGFPGQLILVLGAVALSLGCAGVPLFCHVGRLRWLAYLAIGLGLVELIAAALLLFWKATGALPG